MAEWVTFRIRPRGPPSLMRGWRTPDPSPTRAGLPSSTSVYKVVRELASQSHVGSQQEAVTHERPPFRVNEVRRHPSLSPLCTGVAELQASAVFPIRTPSRTPSPSWRSIDKRGILAGEGVNGEALRHVRPNRGQDPSEKGGWAVLGPMCGHPLSMQAAGVVLVKALHYTSAMQAPANPPALAPSSGDVGSMEQGLTESVAPALPALPRLLSAATPQVAAASCGVTGGVPPADAAPYVTSMGSVGHPYTCGEACKFAKKPQGCKDGAACRRCHQCEWHRRASHRKCFEKAEQPSGLPS